METRERTQPRGFVLRLAIGALALLCLQLVVYLLILRDTVGGVSFTGRAPVPDASMTETPRALLLRSEASERAAGAAAASLRVRAWAVALEQAALPYRVVSEAGLADGLRSSTLLVVPGASCLGEPARAAILRFVEQGRGVIATGAVGTHDDACRWRGYQLLEALTGGSSAAERNGFGPTFAAFRGGQFFSANVPAGYRLELPHQSLLTVNVAHPDAFAADWRLRPSEASVRSSAIAVHRVQGRGRVVWIGFDESPAGRGRSSQQVLEAYLADAARWASKQLLAAVATWPDARPAAVVVAVVAGDDDGRLRRVTRAVNEAGVKPTVVLRSARVPQVDLGRAEIAAAGDLLALSESGAPAAPEAVGRARRALEAATRGSVAGFVSRRGGIDAATAGALGQAGVRYALDEVAGVQGTPELVAVPARALDVARPGPDVVRFFRAAADDQEVLANADGGTPDDTTQGFLRDFDRLRELGGVYPLLVHADLVEPDVVPRVLERVRASGAWLAPASDVARWWAARDRLRVETRRLSPYRVQLDVSNHGQEDVKAVSVLVQLPYRPRRVSLRSPILRLQLPPYALQPDAPVLQLDFAQLDRQSNYTYVISVDE